MFNFFKTSKNPEKELEGLKKAFDILNERYEKKVISLEDFTKQCEVLTKKIEKCRKQIDKNN